MIYMLVAWLTGPVLIVLSIQGLRVRSDDWLVLSYLTLGPAMFGPLLACRRKRPVWGPEPVRGALRGLVLGGLLGLLLLPAEGAMVLAALSSIAHASVALEKQLSLLDLVILAGLGFVGALLATGFADWAEQAHDPLLTVVALPLLTVSQALLARVPAGRLSAANQTSAWWRREARPVRRRGRGMRRTATAAKRPEE